MPISKLSRDLSDEWIMQRTGIRTPHCRPGVATSDLARKAGLEALIRRAG
jgi:3-oxoacyl-[acyl-carrier-protein] synthase III